MTVKATLVTPPPAPTPPSTITLEGITLAQGELIMAALRSFHSDGLLSATSDAKAVEDALESAGIVRKGRLPKAGRDPKKCRQFYVASKSEHSFVMKSVTDPAATDDGDDF